MKLFIFHAFTCPMTSLGELLWGSDTNSNPHTNTNTDTNSNPRGSKSADRSFPPQRPSSSRSSSSGSLELSGSSTSTSGSDSDDSVFQLFGGSSSEDELLSSPKRKKSKESFSEEALMAIIKKQKAKIRTMKQAGRRLKDKLWYRKRKDRRWRIKREREDKYSFLLRAGLAPVSASYREVSNQIFADEMRGSVQSVIKARNAMCHIITALQQSRMYMGMVACLAAARIKKCDVQASIKISHDEVKLILSIFIFFILIFSKCV